MPRRVRYKTCLDCSQNEITTSFDSDIVKKEFQAILQSPPPRPPLSMQCSVLHEVNIHLRSLQLNDDIFEQTEGDSGRTRANRCPFLNAPLQQPYFNRTCAHRYSAEGLLMAFNQAQENGNTNWDFISEIPPNVSIPCPVAGCSTHLSPNMLQSYFLPVETPSSMPESSPLDIFCTDANTDNALPHSQ